MYCYNSIANLRQFAILSGLFEKIKTKQNKHRRNYSSKQMKEFDWTMQSNFRMNIIRMEQSRISFWK